MIEREQSRVSAAQPTRPPVDIAEACPHQRWRRLQSSTLRQPFLPPSRMPIDDPVAAARRIPPAVARRARCQRAGAHLRYPARARDRFRRPVFPACASRELDGRGRHRQGRRAFDRAGRRRARDQRREDRLRLFRRHQRAGADRGGELRARHRPRRQRARRARAGAAAWPRAVRGRGPDRRHRQRGQGRSAARGSTGCCAPPIRG